MTLREELAKMQREMYEEFVWRHEHNVHPTDKPPCRDKRLEEATPQNHPNAGNYGKADE